VRFSQAASKIQPDYLAPKSTAGVYNWVAPAGKAVESHIISKQRYYFPDELVKDRPCDFLQDGEEDL